MHSETEHHDWRNPTVEIKIKDTVVTVSAKLQERIGEAKRTISDELIKEKIIKAGDDFVLILNGEELDEDTTLEECKYKSPELFKGGSTRSGYDKFSLELDFKVDPHVRITAKTSQRKLNDKTQRNLPVYSKIKDIEFEVKQKQTVRDAKQEISKQLKLQNIDISEDELVFNFGWAALGDEKTLEYCMRKKPTLFKVSSICGGYIYLTEIEYEMNPSEKLALGEGFKTVNMGDTAADNRSLGAKITETKATVAVKLFGNNLN